MTEFERTGVVRAEGPEDSWTFKPGVFHNLHSFRGPDVSLVRAHARFAFWTIPSIGARTAMEGFPEFEQFCIAGFPGEHQVFLSRLRDSRW
jgi:hypothetical protein